MLREGINRYMITVERLKIGSSIPPLVKRGAFIRVVVTAVTDFSIDIDYYYGLTSTIIMVCKRMTRYT